MSQEKSKPSLNFDVGIERAMTAEPADQFPLVRLRIGDDKNPPALRRRGAMIDNRLGLPATGNR
jgi:hypothetical protein